MTDGADDGQQARAAADSLVLVVEDDQMMQYLVVAQLDTLGYRTRACTDGAAALAASADAGTGIDVLLTDLVLPGGINGRQLADLLSARYPRLRVLFSTGYSKAVAESRGLLPRDRLVLSKPYRTEDLARGMRAALASPPYAMLPR